MESCGARCSHFGTLALMRATTFTSYSNAYALYIGLKELGVDLSVAQEKTIFPIPQGQSETGDWLFFTEEASLMKALKGQIIGKFHPKGFSERLLDDKWALAAWLAERPNLADGLRQWSVDKKKVAMFPCLLKAKSSWQDERKMPRGWVCESLVELEKQLEAVRADGFREDSFFIQEWLGGLSCRVISVCGFHDNKKAERNLVAVVERIAAHNIGLSCSAAIETIDDDWGVIEKTAAILNEMEFTGPYELEFLVVEDRVCVLELNPRFWMQHAIFFKAKNGVLKRYLGIERSEELSEKILKNVVWFDGVHLLRSTLMLDFRLLKLLVKEYKKNQKSVLLWPSIPIACYVGFKVIWHERQRVFQKIKSMVLGRRAHAI